MTFLTNYVLCTLVCQIILGFHFMSNAKYWSICFIRGKLTVFVNKTLSRQKSSKMYSLDSRYFPALTWQIPLNVGLNALQDMSVFWFCNPIHPWTSEPKGAKPCQFVSAEHQCCSILQRDNHSKKNTLLVTSWVTMFWGKSLDKELKMKLSRQVYCHLFHLLPIYAPEIRKKYYIICYAFEIITPFNENTDFPCWVTYCGIANKIMERRFIASWQLTLIKLFLWIFGFLGRSFCLIAEQRCKWDLKVWLYIQTMFCLGFLP